MHKPKRLPVLREDRTIEIHLTQDYVAIVDFEDVWAAGHNWSALVATDDHVYAYLGGFLLHRLIMDAVPGDGKHIDHINGDTLDCRRSNLRLVSASENLRNRKTNSNNTSGFPGVRKNKNGTYSAKICGDHIGTYDSLDAAVEARIAVEKAEWGIQPRRVYLHSLFPKIDVTSAYYSQRKQRIPRG